MFAQIRLKWFFGGRPTESNRATQILRQTILRCTFLSLQYQMSWELRSTNFLPSFLFQIERFAFAFIWRIESCQKCNAIDRSLIVCTFAHKILFAFDDFYRFRCGTTFALLVHELPVPLSFSLSLSYTHKHTDNYSQSTNIAFTNVSQSKSLFGHRCIFVQHRKYFL